jgi:hypothetical protein
MNRRIEGYIPSFNVLEKVFNKYVQTMVDKLVSEAH